MTDEQAWERFRALVDPWGWGVRAARHGDPESFALVVEFLWQRPRFHGSGYLAEHAYRALATGPDAGALRGRIEDIVVRDLDRRTPTREHRYVRRLAARYWSPDLVRRLGPDRSTGPRADRILEIRRSYQWLGLLPRDATSDG